jgi:iron(III) transport system substrate-binding protein
MKSMAMKMIKIISLLLLAFWLTGCSDERKVVVVYTTVDEVFSEPVLRDFERETGIRVKAVFDTEETKSTGVLNRLIAEKDNPQCDVFWSGDPVRAAILKFRGISMPYDSPEAKDINPIFKDPDNDWIGFSARARVLIYNKNLMDEKDVPRSIFDLAESKYKGNFAIANPMFGTTTFHFAALFTLLGKERALSFIRALKQNKVVIVSSNGEVKKRVARGEVACGLTDTDDAFEAVKDGEPVGIVFLDQHGIGTLIMPNTVNLIKNSPHTENGKKLMDYLISAKTEARLAQSCAQMPLKKGVPVPEGVPSLDNIVPMNVDYDETALKMEEIQDYLKLWAKKR